MNESIPLLKANPMDWLLEEDNPSVRFFTLVELTGRSRRSAEVIEAESQIMKKGVVPKILAKQNKDGYWEEPEKFYTAKYKGTVWQLIILAELGADGNDERIRKACEFILSRSQDLGSGGFSLWTSVRSGGGRHSGVIPCLTGNMVWSLIRLGYREDPRVRKGIDWIVRYQRFDDGILKTPKEWPYDRYESCWGRHTCHMGVVKALKALAEIPLLKRSKSVKNTIEQGAEYLLKHHIHKRSHDLSRISRPKWLCLGFPWMAQTDIVEILLILLKLGCRDHRMQEAVDVVASKQDKLGKWLLESTFNGRYQINIEQKGRPSKWVTLNALRVLKSYYSRSDILC